MYVYMNERNVCLLYVSVCMYVCMYRVHVHASFCLYACTNVCIYPLMDGCDTFMYACMYI
jgi:hypothetical protein